MQTYDWKGRPLVTTNPSITGNPAETTTKEASYSGCGCAGGEDVTITDEGTIDAGLPKRRQQKSYSDVLGLTVKTEVLNWQGGSVYSAIVNTYNARDQVTLVRQFQGPAPVDPNDLSCPNSTCQQSTVTYDGHGRVKTKHAPEQQVDPNNSASTDHTTWDYNPDDTVQKLTDARGASGTYSYNNRHLVTGINYSAPAGITPTSNVTFGYDAAGNRTSMTDGLGSQSYVYDSLSRMISETRTFTGLGNYTISYQYNLANQLSSITNPHGSTVSYARDAAGRVTGVTGTAIPTYTSNIQYRAWGAVKHRNHPNGWAVDSTYNSRMQPASFTVTSRISKTYEYWADGRLRFSSDHRDHRFDRYYGFDHAGRISEAFSGAEARFEPPTTDRPYRQTYGYDAMGHLTGRDMKRWYLNWSMADNYTNNRRGGWGYDADGRLTSGPEGPFTHDAAGRNTNLETSSNGNTGVFGYDGDGRLVKTEESTWDPNSFSYSNETKHFVRSSVLGGQVLTELLEGASGTYIYAGTTVFAREVHFFGGSTFLAWWEDKDPSGATVWLGGLQQELDPTGADNGTFIESVIPDEGAFASYGSSYNPANPSMTYSTDGIRVTLDDFILRMGRVANDPTALMEVAARASSRPIGYRNSGVRWGERFDVIYDANRRITSEYWGNLDPELRGVIYGVETPIYDYSLSQLARFLTSPQNTGPRIPQGTDDKYIKAFNKALEELKKRLDKQKCADFFGGKEKALATINGAEYRFLPLGGPKVDRNTGDVSVVGAATNSATSVFINTQGPFLNQNMFVPGAGLKTLDLRSGLRGASFGALILLHELGHQLDIFGPDKDKPDLNRKYTQQVLDACFR